MKTLFPGLRAAKAINLVLKKVVATSDMHLSCDMHLDGTRLGSFVDHGDGGHGNFVVINKHREQLFAALRKGRIPGLPSIPSAGIFTPDPDTVSDHDYAESVMANLICETQLLKTVKRKCKTHLLIVFNDSAGEYTPYKMAFNDESRKAATAKFGDRISFFVNEDILSL